VNCVTFNFNKTKAIESILYLADRIPNPDVYGICKLLYLIDKTRLEKYGSFMFGESYYAMKEGATPSNAYDLLKSASNDPIEGLQVKGNQIKVLRKPNLEYLSEADIECLDLIIDEYGRLPNWEKRKYAHDEAWREAWANKGSNNSVLMPIESVAKYLEDSDELIDYLWYK
jgi:uncharacterized phage-associated protein